MLVVAKPETIADSPRTKVQNGDAFFPFLYVGVGRDCDRIKILNKPFNFKFKI